MCQITVPAHGRHLAQVRHRLREWLSANCVGATRVQDVVLVATEASTNSIEHGYQHTTDGEITVTANLGLGVVGSQVVLTVADDGRWTHPVQDTRPGLGLELSRRVSDQLWITHGRPTTVTALFTLPCQAPTVPTEVDGHTDGHVNGDGRRTVAR